MSQYPFQKTPMVPYQNGGSISVSSQVEELIAELRKTKLEVKILHYFLVG